MIWCQMLLHFSTNLKHRFVPQIGLISKPCIRLGQCKFCLKTLTFNTSVYARCNKKLKKHASILLFTAHLQRSSLLAICPIAFLNSDMVSNAPAFLHQFETPFRPANRTHQQALHSTWTVQVLFKDANF